MFPESHRKGRQGSPLIERRSRDRRRDIREAQLRGGRWGLIVFAPVPLIALFVGSVWENIAIWTAFLVIAFLVLRVDS